MPFAVISGATGGIGTAVAHRLYQEDYPLLLLGRNTQKLRHLCTDLAVRYPYGPQLWTHSIDLMQWEEGIQLDEILQELAQTVGICTLLVTCHGAASRIKPSLDVTPEDWEIILNTDLRGTFWLCQEVGRHMLPPRGKGGSMVLLSSFHATGTYPERAPYAAAKTGVCSIARSLAVEWGKFQVRVNALTPGQVWSPRGREIAKTNRAILDAWQARSPAYRLLDADDIAETVLWLTRTPGVTGQSITLDHGVSVSYWYEPFAPPKG